MGRPAAGDRPARPDSDTTWVKSSRSYANGNCVEVAFQRSSHSIGSGQCAEVARLPAGQVLVRDSKQPGGPVLRFTPRAWQAFAAAVRTGETDGSGRNTAVGNTP